MGHAKMSFFDELKRRNVFRVAFAYIVLAWLVMQVVDVVLGNVSAPGWVFQVLMLFLAIGFPFALIFAWAFELTPEGLKKEKDIERSESVTPITGRKLDFVIIGLLTAALGYFAYDKFVASPPTPQDSDTSIAVMPFINMSSDPEQEFLSDGLSEELLNLLAKVPELRVAARTSSFSFKDQNLEIPEIAERLNVAHVLEGSVRKAGNQIRITAQLIKADDGFHIWSATYNRELEDIFAIQDEIAAAVVAELRITLLGEVPKVTETNPEAYALYLQGRYIGRQRGSSQMYRQAEKLLTQSLEIDPDFPPALTELGLVYRDQGNFVSILSIDEGNKRAREAFQRAVTVDSQYGPAIAGLALIEMFYDWDFTSASKHFQQALALNPDDTLILQNAAYLDRFLGRLDQSIELYRRSIALDPVSPLGHYNLGRTLYAAHQLEEAAVSLHMAMSLAPSGPSGAQYFYGKVLLAQEDTAGALAAMEQERDDGYRRTGLAIVHHALGDTGASDAALQELIDIQPDHTAYQIAEVYAYRGEIDNAFEWLERSYDNRDSGMPLMMLDPLLVKLHDDPRWEPFLDKIGFPR
jgi:adenylate cyclase